MIKKQKAAGLPVRSGAFCIVCQGMAFGKEKSMADIFDLFKQIAKKDDTPIAPISWIIVGLGNPGNKYRNTRHNAGFLMIDRLADALGVQINRARFHALCAEATVANQRVLLIKPQTMMNASGLAVQEAAAFYKIAPDHILVISDDITQAPGKMRLRKKGSAGGQKGLNDIIVCLGTDEIPRLRMGVGEKPHPDYDLASWVISDFSDAEMALLNDTFPDMRQGIENLLNGKFDTAVQICNSHRPTQNPDQKDQ